MKGWVSTILFLSCFIVGVPICILFTWIGFEEYEPLKILLFVAVVIIAFHMVYSVYLIIKKVGTDILEQAIIAQIFTLTIQVVVLLICLMEEIRKNRIATAGTHPILWVNKIYVIIFIGFISSLRGIACVVNLFRKKKLSVSEGAIYGMKQFIPFVNIRDSIQLKKRANKR